MEQVKSEVDDAFVPFVLEGETVEAILLDQKPGFARARADQIVAASPQRIEPRCPYFQRCGGCHYQHTSYEHQLEIKAAILNENLRRIAKVELDIELKVHPSPPWNYRNRTRLKVQGVPEFALGYYRLNSHELLPVEECPISSPLINRAIAAMWRLGHAGKVPTAIREIEVFVNADDTQLLAEGFCSSDITGSAEQFAGALRDRATNALRGEALSSAGMRHLTTPRGRVVILPKDGMALAPEQRLWLRRAALVGGGLLAGLAAIGLVIAVVRRVTGASDGDDSSDT